MRPHTNIMEAMLHCKYKAWQLAKSETTEESWEPGVPSTGKNTKQDQKTRQLLADAEALIKQEAPPPFYKIPHCSECAFKKECHQKLKDRDCISLLPAMSLKSMAKYHNKGITTITQLSYLFKPRRRRAPHPQSSYLWELKALAIREQKTFVIEPPVFDQGRVAIYLDFEGTSEQNHIYLLGGLIIQDELPGERFSFWSDHKSSEKQIFLNLFERLQQYPDALIYHYGSYESQALKQAIKKWPDLSKVWPAIEKRLVNLLGYLRTHVYPPTYGNGLKEVVNFLSFQWQNPEADGFLSMDWRRQWERSGLDEWKNQLLQYNQDDCSALYHFHQWLDTLASGATADKVQQVAQMKKHTPYRLQNNLDYGEDFQLISKAAYFNYQRDKIYWRKELKKQSPAGSSVIDRPKPGQGQIAWQPKQVNELVIVPPLKSCPHCGHTKLYQSHTTKTAVKQTDLKFTPTGIRQHVVEYRSGTAKCANCGMKTGNKNLRMMHYGDNLFAVAINYYVSYHISNEMISKLIREHYGIWISPMYLVMYKNRWWTRNWEPVADYIKKIVLHSPVIHIDETTIKLARESGYVWVFATSHTVFYHYASTREVSFLQELLKDYQGIIVSDFYPGYETLNVRSQKCLIHLIRDLNDDLFRNQFDEPYKGMVAAFSRLMRIIVETIDKHGLRKSHLAKHVRDTEVFYSTFVEVTYTSELASKYAKRFKKHWAQLWTFLYCDNVPWNNNNAEAAVKAFAQHRRGVKGQMHVKGIHDFLQMLTVAQTCRYRNISFLKFLRKEKGIWENVPPDVLPGFLPFEQSKLYVHRLGFDRTAEWMTWKNDGNRPPFIASNPQLTYLDKGWVDWHDWLGCGFLPFVKARTYVRRLQLKNRQDYKQWLASGKRPKDIPANPEKEYRHTGWVSMKDWIGIG